MDGAQYVKFGEGKAAHYTDCLAVIGLTSRRKETDAKKLYDLILQAGGTSEAEQWRLRIDACDGGTKVEDKKIVKIVNVYLSFKEDYLLPNVSM